jgi:hypothetical protein
MAALGRLRARSRYAHLAWSGRLRGPKGDGQDSLGCCLPRSRLSGSRQPSLGRSLAVASHAIGFADPRHDIHSPGFRSYEDDGDDQAGLRPGQEHDRRAISVQLATVADGQSWILAGTRTRRSAALTRGDLLSSQADSASSILVTRSTFAQLMVSACPAARPAGRHSRLSCH